MDSILKEKKEKFNKFQNKEMSNKFQIVLKIVYHTVIKRKEEVNREGCK